MTGHILFTTKFLVRNQIPNHGTIGKCFQLHHVVPIGMCKDKKEVDYL